MPQYSPCANWPAIFSPLRKRLPAHLDLTSTSCIIANQTVTYKMTTGCQSAFWLCPCFLATWHNLVQQNLLRKSAVITNYSRLSLNSTPLAVQSAAIDKNKTVHNRDWTLHAIQSSTGTPVDDTNDKPQKCIEKSQQLKCLQPILMINLPLKLNIRKLFYHHTSYSVFLISKISQLRRHALFINAWRLRPVNKIHKSAPRFQQTAYHAKFWRLTFILYSYWIGGYCCVPQSMESGMCYNKFHMLSTVSAVASRVRLLYDYVDSQRF